MSSNIPVFPDTLASELGVTALSIAGISLNVFGLKKVHPTQTDVAVAFFLHARTGKQEHLYSHVDRILSRTQQAAPALPLLIVTFDQRNHGSRVVDDARNIGWGEGQSGVGANPSHASDMYSIQTGTAQDVSLLIDFLPAALFPNAEHSITRWVCMGVSLGGHATWIAGSRDTRITHLVPIIGSPSMLMLLHSRAAKAKPPIDFAPPVIPTSLLELFKRTDPAEVPLSAWSGKHILVLCGATDQLVPYKEGGTEAFVTKLKREVKDAAVDVWLQDGVGHALTKEMDGKCADWLVRQALR